MDEGIGSAAGELYLNFHLCDKKEDVVVDEQAKGAHTVFPNNNIIVRTITDDNFIMVQQEMDVFHSQVQQEMATTNALPII